MAYSIQWVILNIWIRGEWNEKLVQIRFIIRYNNRWACEKNAFRFSLAEFSEVAFCYYQKAMSSHYRTKESRQILFEFIFLQHRHRRCVTFSLSLSPTRPLSLSPFTGRCVMLFNAQHQRRLHWKQFCR